MMTPVASSPETLAAGVEWGGGVFHSHDLSHGTSTLNRVDIAHRLFSSPILVSMRKRTQHGGYEFAVCVV